MIVFGLNQLTHNAARVKSMAVGVILADQKGEDTIELLKNLRQFSSTHLNSSVEVTLESSYARAVDAAKASSVPSTNGAIYAQAQQACAKGDSVTQSQCVRGYVSGRLQATAGNPAPAPEIEDYRYSFKSPSWALDGAGTSIGLGVVLVVAGFLNWLPRKRHK